MTAVTKRETVHALLDRVPDDQLEPIAQLLASRAVDGTDLSAQAILARHGASPMSAADFDRHFGHLPTDGEG